MKTRIISGIVMGAIVAAVLAVGLLWNDIVISIFVSILAAIAIYELVKNVGKVNSKAAIIGAMIYVFFATASFLTKVSTPEYLLHSYRTFGSELVYKLLPVFFLSIIYFVYAVIMVLKNHKDLSLGSILMITAMPIVIVCGFGCLGSVINLENGLYYLLLLFNFSSICDMGAYFTGVTIGKHKLCPEISPKKTIEGAIGGIIASVIFAVVFVFAFGMQEKLIATILLTIPLCIVGMMGDLFASSLKRAVSLKDYGSLIPGHGGVLDRLDSMLLIAPVLYLFITFGVL